jgi:hypothetical protein
MQLEPWVVDVSEYAYVREASQLALLEREGPMKEALNLEPSEDFVQRQNWN